MTEADQELVEGYVRICAPVEFVDWWFKSEGTPARECLHAALFDEMDRARQLDTPEVRSAVIDCIRAHEQLFDIVAKRVDETVERLAEKWSEASGAWMQQSRCACGLASGDRLRVVRVPPVVADSGREILTGEIWTVLGGDPDKPAAWLEQPDGEWCTLPDDETIFEFFEKLPAIDA